MGAYAEVAETPDDREFARDLLAECLDAHYGKYGKIGVKLAMLLFQSGDVDESFDLLENVIEVVENEAVFDNSLEAHMCYAQNYYFHIRNKYVENRYAKEDEILTLEEIEKFRDIINGLRASWEKESNNEWKGHYALERKLRLEAEFILLSTKFAVLNDELSLDLQQNFYMKALRLFEMAARIVNKRLYQDHYDEPRCFLGIAQCLSHLGDVKKAKKYARKVKKHRMKSLI